MSSAHIEPRPGRRGRLAAAVSLAAVAVVAVVGVAGAAQERAPATVYIADSASGQCFTTVPGKPACAPGDRGDVTIETGETVTWNFAGPPSAHNAKATNSVAADPTWATYATPYVTTGSGVYSRQFDAPGSYDLSASRTPPWSGRSRSSRAPGRGRRRRARRPPRRFLRRRRRRQLRPLRRRRSRSPPPRRPTITCRRPLPAVPPGKDTVAPRLASTTLKALKRAVRVRFRLSEPATVDGHGQAPRLAHGAQSPRPSTRAPAPAP